MSKTYTIDIEAVIICKVEANSKREAIDQLYDNNSEFGDLNILNFENGTGCLHWEKSDFNKAIKNIEEF